MVTAIALAFANRTWLTGMMAFGNFHVHLFEDVIGARGPEGYQWPIPYLSPFPHAADITWSHQWGAECVAELCDHCSAACSYAISRLEPRIFAA